ncbi:MAG: hypothetical protein ACRDPH_16530 [Marmoricola sp.]
MSTTISGTNQPTTAHGIALPTMTAVVCPSTAVASAPIAARMRDGLTADVREHGLRAFDVATADFGRYLGPRTWSPPIT